MLYKLNFLLKRKPKKLKSTTKNKIIFINHLIVK